MNMNDLDTSTRRRLSLLFMATALMAASLLTGWLRPGQEALQGTLALVATLIVAAPIVSGVITAIRATGFAATQFYMDQYVVLALAACLATGKYVTGGIVAIILLFGQMLEERTTVGVEMALSKLRQLSRIRARRKSSEGEHECEASELRPGDEIVIRPGEIIPADSTVISGQALIDQSRITGESVPIEASPGTAIFAGTANLNGSLHARVTGSGSDTVMGRVQSIIEQAKESEAPIISLAEDYARYYTPLILLIAASVFFFSQDIERAIAVLVVSIPCAFVLASPSAMVSAIASASRMGLLIKSVRHLETARRVDTVVFDKTGTLTLGHLELEDVLVHDDRFSRDEVIRLAASLESQSNHPVARAIAQAGEGMNLTTPSDFMEHSGLGLEGKCEEHTLRIGRSSWLRQQGVQLAIDPGQFNRHSLVLLADGDRHIASFLLADQVRSESREAVERLRSLGIENFHMLTGDRREAAEHIAAQVGITHLHAECLPEDKVAHIRALKAAGQRVLVIGDGLNDAPALAEGDVGVAMGSLGNDVTVHTSDIALMSHDLRRLPDLLLLSAKTVGIINQNLLCGFAFIILAISLSSLGFISPVAAAFMHEFSAFFVIFNSARLLRFDGLELLLDEENPQAPSLETATPMTPANA
ncbi:Cd2+/Zn2+-exporting ATPase [Prosthecobacter debontii]|uniref:P-type Zn(2+) transporter n=2 Tax=Prosthecobacter debontii TaxID=48467 RepID=A0A1T4WM78_9BACT|nr:Cd2+/Zn2+-exporting ATPase [Prosthecobacter debontii]